MFVISEVSTKEEDAAAAEGVSRETTITLENASLIFFVSKKAPHGIREERGCATTNNHWYCCTGVADLTWVLQPAQSRTTVAILFATAIFFYFFTMVSEVIIEYNDHILHASNLINACQHCRVTLWQPERRRSIASTFKDLHGTIQETLNEPPSCHFLFKTKRDAFEYIVNIHCNEEDTLTEITERSDIWSHVYNCNIHPPCERCKNCQMFKDVLSDFSLEHVIELVDGKSGSYYAFDCRSL